ncbi:MAG TPA: glycosyltransferase, partial [Solirubrobacteraceae bacterium]|nr:glycosyltransferase [Solirubrobacteraceae bacterium]
QAGALADPQQRYWANTTILEAGLAVDAGLPAGVLVALATGALGALEREPREPRLLALAGEVLLALEEHAAGAELIAAARRLDPALAESALAAEPRAAGGRALTAPPARRQDAARSQLRERALALGPRARPADGLRLSLCMIVRDEQQTLERCLAAVADAVDEIVVLDTGSRDATIEIARSFGARVLEQPWNGSFAQARNASLDAAEGDWLMCLDADEVLVREDVSSLRSLTGRVWREAFLLDVTSYTGEQGAGTAVTHSALRIVRNRPQYRFEGRVHEQIAHRLPGYLPERFEATGIRVEHFGYLGAVRRRRAKSARNVELLRLQRAEGDDSAFLHYNLGAEHAAAGEPEAAVLELERAWALLRARDQRADPREAGREDARGDPRKDAREDQREDGREDGRGRRRGGEDERARAEHPFEPALLSRLTKALRACGRPREALARAGEGLERHPDFTDLVFEQALAARALGQHERAAALLRRCLEMGDAPRRYTATVGCGSFLALVQLAELARVRGEDDEAIALLERCLREHPAFAGAVLPYADALLAAGLDAETVVARVERELASPSSAARFMLATALLEAGASAAGEQQLRAVLASEPQNARARVALAEALLAQRRYEEAAASASALPDEHPLAPLARRSELFALLAAGEHAAAEPVLARARASGMDGEELELFAGWRELAAGAQTRVAPGAGAVRRLEVMLEALLRVQDFEAFELLVGLLHRARLQPREVHELLAALYLRRGFAASAAQEWMAVCRERPDARALLGLARVAVAGGMPREAADFAAAALAHDPGDEAARALLAQAREQVACA